MKTLRLFLTLIIVTASAEASPATLRVIGSNTFGEKLGPLLVSGFKRKNPGIAVELKRPGSGAGLSSLIAGQSDIAPTSRPANADEIRAAKNAGVRLLPQNIGSYGVAVIVNEANPVKNLKPSQVRALFNGKTTNWSKVRGFDKPVNVFVLGPNTGGRAGFQTLVMHGDAYAPAAKALPDYSAIAAAVSRNPDAIGYVDMGPLPKGARSLLIGGEPANSAAIYEQVYPYANTLYLYTLEGRASPTAKKFIRYVLSKGGQRIITKAGFVPRLTAPHSVSSGLTP
jgi:phosphate transport system substrate-binding protein